MSQPCVFFSLFLSTSFTEKVTEIKTNIFVTSFGPVSDTEMVRSVSDFQAAAWYDQDGSH